MAVPYFPGGSSVSSDDEFFVSPDLDFDVEDGPGVKRGAGARSVAPTSDDEYHMHSSTDSNLVASRDRINGREVEAGGPRYSRQMDSRFVRMGDEESSFKKPTIIIGGVLAIVGVVACLGLLYRFKRPTDYSGRLRHSIDDLSESNKTCKMIADPICKCPDSPYSNHERKRRAAKLISLDISLGFVIDTTGSMGEVISNIKTGITKILERNKKFKLFSNYVIQPFKDYLEDTLTTNDASRVIKFIGDLSSCCGDDCPEEVLASILHTATQASAGSYIFVFTDASTKKVQDLEKTLKLLRKKKISIIMILTENESELPLCGWNKKDPAKLHKDPYREYPPYAALSGVENGRLLILTSTKQITSVMDFISAGIKNGITAFKELPQTVEDIGDVSKDLEKCKCLPKEKLECIAKDESEA